MDNRKNNLKFDDIEKKINDLDKTIVDNFEDLSNKHLQNFNKIESNNQNLIEIIGQMQTIEATTNEMEQKTNRFENSINNIETQFENIEENILQINSQFDSINSNIEINANHISSLQTKTTENENNIIANSNSLNSVKNDLQVVSGVLNNISSSLENVSDKADSNSTKINEVDNFALDLERRIVENNNLINQIENKGYTTASVVDSKDATTLNSAKNYADTKIANLVNSAPATLDTLGELATALQENNNVVDALNTAISSKANKNELPTKTSQLTNDSGFLTSVPSEYINETELANKGYETIANVNSKDTSTLNSAKAYTNEKISNMLTTNTEQTITADKMFSGRLKCNTFIDIYNYSKTNNFSFGVADNKLNVMGSDTIAFDVSDDTNITDFKKTPTVNGVELATKTDLEENGNVVVDAELSSTSANPVQNKAIAKRLTSMSQDHNLLKTDVNNLNLEIQNNKTNISGLQTQINNAGLAINQNALEINTLETAISNCAKNDLSNITYPLNTPGSTTTGTGDRVINTYISSDGNTWFRVYKSGWKEMGGTVSGSTSFQTVNLPISFSNANYKIVGSYVKSAEDASVVCFRVASKTASSFRCALTWIWHGNGYSSGGFSGTSDQANWYACGY